MRSSLSISPLYLPHVQLSHKVIIHHVDNCLHFVLDSLTQQQQVYRPKAIVCEPTLFIHSLSLSYSYSFFNLIVTNWRPLNQNDARSRAIESLRPAAT